MRTAAAILAPLSIYLLYLGDAQFVLDDWWLFQHFARAASRWEMARALVENTLWGSFRTNGLSFLAVYGLWGLAGMRAAWYFAAGLALHGLVGYLLYRVVDRLGLGRGTAVTAAALFVVLPTTHNPLFWFPSCAHYLISAAWLLVYLYSAAGEWTWRAGLLQAAAVTMAFLSGDQVFGLLAGSAVWIAVVLRRRQALRAAAVAWATMAVVGLLYAGWVNRAPVAGTVAAKFDFRATRVIEVLREMAADWWRLAGVADEYYRVGWAALAAGVLVGVVVWPALGGRREAPRKGAALGLGLAALGWAPVLVLRWRELRYDYLPSLALALALAAIAPRPVAAALVGWSAATAVAEIRQCWSPMARHTGVVVRALQRLENVRDHDIVVVAGTPARIGTAPHFGMYLSYSSTPFVETATGVFGLIVGRAIQWDSGRLGLEHADFFREVRPEELARAHVVACDALDACSPRTVLAREVEPARFELRALKNYRGPPLDPARVYSRDEVDALGGCAT